jgi:Cu-Zn family superoxide dismutase
MHIPARLFGSALACCALVGCKANPERPEDPAAPLAVDERTQDPMLRDEARRDYVRPADASTERRRMNDPSYDPRYDDVTREGSVAETEAERRIERAERDARDARNDAERRADLAERDARHDAARRAEMAERDARGVRYDSGRRVVVAQGDAVTLPEHASQSDPRFHMLDVRAGERREVEWVAADGTAVGSSRTLPEHASQSDPRYAPLDVRTDAERQRMAGERVGVAEASARRGHAAMTTRRATAVLSPVGDSGVKGSLAFEQVDRGVRVRGRITGLSPGPHGFHVHEYGDVTDRTAGKTAGDHYGPGGTPHGRREDEKRHAGDLGNIVADANGVANVDFVDGKLRLDGEHSILGRSIVVHAGEDKFTQPVGDAGARVAVGVIGIAADVERDVPPAPPADRR